MNKIVKGAVVGVGGLAVLTAGFFGGAASRDDEVETLKGDLVSQGETLHERNETIDRERERASDNQAVFDERLTQCQTGIGLLMEANDAAIDERWYTATNYLKEASEYMHLCDPAHWNDISEGSDIL